jgi:hypothetical protein
MVLETVSTDEPHQLLQLRHVDDGARAERAERIVGQLATL